MKCLAATIRIGAAMMALLSLQPVAAAVWNFSICNGSTVSPGTASGSQTNAGTVNNSYACAATGSTARDLTVSAWGAISSAINSYGSANVFNRGTDGFGVGAQSEGGPSVTGVSAALDNDPTSLAPNLILLSFGTAVILDQVTLGWSLNDADLTVMAYTGAGTPATFIGGKTASDLTAGGAGAGWSLIEAVGDAAPDAAYPASGSDISYFVNATGVESSYWLIGSYSPLFGGGPLDSLVDYVDLLSVSAHSAIPVHEPRALALTGIVLLSLITARRRRASRPITL